MAPYCRGTVLQVDKLLIRRLLFIILSIAVVGMGRLCAPNWGIIARKCYSLATTIHTLSLYRETEKYGRPYSIVAVDHRTLSGRSMNLAGDGLRYLINRLLSRHRAILWGDTPTRKAAMHI